LSAGAAPSPAPCIHQKASTYGASASPGRSST
jgi:hypothetical protein